MTAMNARLSKTEAGDFAGWPPEGRIFPVKSLSLAVLEGEHPFHVQQRQAAEANWAAETARNPAFFNGGLFLQRRLVYDEGRIFGEAHVVPYSTFLWWRRQPVSTLGAHLFGLPVLISSDNALVAIRMSQSTANPGQVYFATGSLDESDLCDGHCDLESNMRREVQEETGLRLEEAAAEPGLYASHQNRRVAVYRLFRFSRTAEDMLAAIRNHHDSHNEIDDAVIIRSADPTAHHYAPSMLPFIEWFFGKR